MVSGTGRSYVEVRPALIRRRALAAEKPHRLDSPMPERAALVTGASSGIGLRDRAHAGRGGIRPDARRPPAGEARGGGRRAARRRLRGRGRRREHGRRGRHPARRRRSPRALGPARRARQQRRRRHRRGGRRRADQADRHAARRQPPRGDPLLPRMRRPAARGRRRAPQRAGGEHVLDLREVRAGVAERVLGDQGGGDRLDAGDEQGAQRRRDQVGRAVPRVRRHRR